MNTEPDKTTPILEYCERKILPLSPILGFSRKNYFIVSNISDDVQMEILSYLKPIEIFQTILLINKQFNENVKMIHKSYRYSNIFCNKNFTFESFDEIENLWNNDKNEIDMRIENGCWVHGRVEGIKRQWM